jgi:hypothetical protein
MAARYCDSTMSAVDLADNYALTGNHRRALEWLERAYDAKAFALFTIRLDKAIPSTFFEDAGWQTTVAKTLVQGLAGRR